MTVLYTHLYIYIGLEHLKWANISAFTSKILVFTAYMYNLITMTSYCVYVYTKIQIYGL